MTRHRIAQIAENQNPKSPENRRQTHRFLQNRLLQSRRLPPHRQSVSRSSRATSAEQFKIHHAGQPLQGVTLGRKFSEPLVNVEKPPLFRHCRSPAPPTDTESAIAPHCQRFLEPSH
jgi:hypothetical protein